MSYQIFIGIDKGKLQPMRIYEDMGKGSEATWNEAREAFSFEEATAQQAADYNRSPVSIELRNLNNGYLMAHKRFMPRDLLQ